MGLTFQQLLQAGPHYVDVLDADKLEANVGVVVLVLIAFTCCSVSQRVQLQDRKITRGKNISRSSAGCSVEPCFRTHEATHLLNMKRTVVKGEGCHHLTFGLVSMT